jgi:hypothetical protein
LALLEYLGDQEPDFSLSKEESETLAISTVLVSQLVSIEKNERENFCLFVETLSGFDNWCKLIDAKSLSLK